jgi:hypothetical protein
LFPAPFCYPERWIWAADAPPLFHLGAALALAGRVLAETVWLPWGADRVVPNLWVGLVAGGPCLREAAALRLAVQVASGLPSLNEVQYMADAPLRRWVGNLSLQRPKADREEKDAGAPEELISLLSPRNRPRTNPVLGVVGDLAGWLRLVIGSGGRQACRVLAAWHDVPEFWFGNDRGRGADALAWPCVSLLGTCPADWLARQCRAGEHPEFWSRWLFFPAAGKDHTRALPAPLDEYALEQVMFGLEALGQARGAMSLSPGARGLYAGWVEDQERQCPADQRGPWCSRLGTAALKVAMIYEASREGSLVISAEAMRPALALVSRLRATLVEVLAPGLEDRRGEDYRRVSRAIQAAGPEGIAHPVLLKELRPMLAGRLRSLVRTLEESEQISIHKEGQAIRYRWV